MVRNSSPRSAVLTPRGESGVYGFLPHLDSRPAAQLLLQSITTEARQQMVFRQFSGAHPMPVWFESGISQAMSWSLLSRYITSCPSENPRIEFPIFPWLSVTNEPNLLQDGYEAAITHNRTTLSKPGDELQLSWSAPGETVSYDGLYNTSIGGLINGTTPAFAAFISQLNVTYSPVTVTGENTGTTVHPEGFLFEDINNGESSLSAQSRRDVGDSRFVSPSFPSTFFSSLLPSLPRFLSFGLAC